jgi:hypothetical protein
LILSGKDKRLILSYIKFRNSASLSPSSFRSPFTSTDDEMKGCLCRDKREGKTINCDNSRCPIGWFHERCVTDKIEEGKKWYCKICRNKENSTELRFVYRLLNDRYVLQRKENIGFCHLFL